MQLKNNVEMLRLKAGMSVYQLAKQCGFISSTNHVLGRYVKSAEDGNNVTVETALMLFETLKKAGVCEHFDEVFWLEESKPYTKLTNTPKNNTIAPANIAT